MKTFPILTVAALFAGLLSAQNPNSILLSPKTGESSRSGSGGTSLRSISARSVAVVTPTPAYNHSAELFLPQLAWQTMAGDEDGDADVYTPQLMTGIDAILVTPYEWDRTLQQPVPRTRPIDARDVFISPATDVGTVVSGAPGLRKGDCGTIVRTPAGNGQVMHFITAEQIIAALGLVYQQNGQPITAQDLNLDGIAVDRDRAIYLSFEDTHALRRGPVLFPLEDGGVAVIPPGGWAPDTRGNVASVIADSGAIVLSEAQVDAMVVNAGVASSNGACVNAIGDNDGLEIDPNGGTFVATWNGINFNVPNLLFCGERLTCCGVLTTRLGGQIARVNATDLARACGAGATDGTQVGLRANLEGGSLDGLAVLEREPCRFVVHTSTPTGLGGMVSIDIGTNLAVPNAVLFLGLGALPVSPSVNARGFWPNSVCFPEIYLGAVTGFSFGVAFAPDGWGGRVATFGPVGLPAVAQGVVFQAATIVGADVEFSTPMTMH